MKRCDGCKGKKDIVGLGMLKDKCKVCNGIGYVVQSESMSKNVKYKESNKNGERTRAQAE